METPLIKKILKPVEEFMHLQAASGIVLITCTIIALFLANSGFHEEYFNLLHLDIGIQLGSFNLTHGIGHWINDGLMVIFFFVVGLEIKRELAHGALSDVRRASLPLLAAVGGMVVPALVYFTFNGTGPASSGWGIPMATDIAFALGVLALLGNRVPMQLKVLLLALAIADDLGAVLVIAAFYTAEISSAALLSATGIFLVTYAIQKAGVRNLLPYVLLGIAAWLAVLASGVHATVAGVILGFLTPVSALIPASDLEDLLSERAERLKRALKKDVHRDGMITEEAAEALRDLEFVAREGKSPVDRLISKLHLWVAFFIMPIFALVNAGVRLEGFEWASLFTNPVANGISYGLLVGKPVGIFIFAWLAVKIGLSDLPRGVNWGQIVGLGFLAGIGFTMALFIGNLALPTEDLQVFVKLGILKGSIISALVGLLILHLTSKKKLTGAKP